jgi:hypothetical protein
MNQQPADRHPWDAATILQGGTGGDFDDAVGLAIPKTDPVARPDDGAILEDAGELLLGLALDRRGALSCGRFHGHRV